jgi:drug/metabolite transporter (DMT)-like permease
MALSPGFVALGGTLLIGDALTSTQWGGLLLMITGMYVIQLEGDSAWWRPFVRLFIDQNQWVIVLALFASVAVALMDKTILSGYKIPPQIFITVQQWYLAGLFLVIVAIRKTCRTEETMPWNRNLVLGLFVLAVVTVGYRYLQMRGVMLAPVALVLAVRRTSVVMASLIGGSLFQEKGFIRRSIAAAILAVGAILLSQTV